MMRALRHIAFFAIVLTSSWGTPPPLNSENTFINSVEFLSENLLPGSVIAIRLKNTPNKENSLRVCFRMQCLALTNRWELLPTNPDTPDAQLFLLEDKLNRWSFEKIELDTNMFDKIKIKITNLRLPASVADLLKTSDKAVEFEKSYNKQIHIRNSALSWGKQWTLPIPSAITSPFGTLRTAEDGASYTHKGVDLRAPMGTAVATTSDGWVVATLEQMVSGKVITIDHGHGVMSKYLHLSEFKVKIKEQVRAGQIIALSGTSGRSEAPHLHWEIRVRGYPVDPLSTARLMARLSYPE
ncbi:MAG: M23 family metallopeptidase [Oligoflexia bacterium]|nr:M23 family metallopeptidase [Oligoflexia bacterium]